MALPWPTSPSLKADLTCNYNSTAAPNPWTFQYRLYDRSVAVGVAGLINGLGIGACIMVLIFTVPLYLRAAKVRKDMSIQEHWLIIAALAVYNTVITIFAMLYFIPNSLRIIDWRVIRIKWPPQDGTVGIDLLPFDPVTTDVKTLMPFIWLTGALMIALIYRVSKRDILLAGPFYIIGTIGSMVASSTFSGSTRLGHRAHPTLHKFSIVLLFSELVSFTVILSLFINRYGKSQVEHAIPPVAVLSSFVYLCMRALSIVSLFGPGGTHIWSDTLMITAAAVGHQLMIQHFLEDPSLLYVRRIRLESDVSETNEIGIGNLEQEVESLPGP